MNYKRATELHSVPLKTMKIGGERIEFQREYHPFAPNQFAGRQYVQAYRKGYPFSAGFNKKEAVQSTRQMLRVMRKWDKR